MPGVDDGPGADEQRAGCQACGGRLTAICWKCGGRACARRKECLLAHAGVCAARIREVLVSRALLSLGQDTRNPQAKAERMVTSLLPLVEAWEELYVSLQEACASGNLGRAREGVGELLEDASTAFGRASEQYSTSALLAIRVYMACGELAAARELARRLSRFWRASGRSPQDQYEMVVLSALLGEVERGVARHGLGAGRESLSSSGAPGFAVSGALRPGEVRRAPLPRRLNSISLLLRRGNALEACEELNLLAGEYYAMSPAEALLYNYNCLVAFSLWRSPAKHIVPARFLDTRGSVPVPGAPPEEVSRFCARALGWYMHRLELPRSGGVSAWISEGQAREALESFRDIQEFVEAVAGDCDQGGGEEYEELCGGGSLAVFALQAVVVRLGLFLAVALSEADPGAALACLDAAIREYAVVTSAAVSEEMGGFAVSGGAPGACPARSLGDTAMGFGVSAGTGMCAGVGADIGAGTSPGVEPGPSVELRLSSPGVAEVGQLAAGPQRGRRADLPRGVAGSPLLSSPTARSRGRSDFAVSSLFDDAGASAVRPGREECDAAASAVRFALVDFEALRRRVFLLEEFTGRLDLAPMGRTPRREVLRSLGVSGLDAEAIHRYLFSRRCGRLHRSQGPLSSFLASGPAAGETPRGGLSSRTAGRVSEICESLLAASRFEEAQTSGTTQPRDVDTLIAIYAAGLHASSLRDQVSGSRGPQVSREQEGGRVTRSLLETRMFDD